MNNLVSPFDSKDYKQYLRKRLAQEVPFSIKQADLARVAGCQPSYLSQCLNGKIHLLPEQLYSIGTHLGLSESEQNFLQLLIQHDRSSSKEHQNYLKLRMKVELDQHSRISSRLERDSVSSADLRSYQAYYKDWFVLAAHILCSLPGIRGSEDIAEKLGLAKKQSEDALKTLIELELVQRERGFYKSNFRHLHIPDTDPLIGKHHANWRMVAALRSHPAPASDFHYTGVYSLSERDALYLREVLAQTLLKIRDRVKSSPEEVVVAFNMDWFQLA